MTVLTTHNASITTATVEIKTLTVSGKQVTLAVFRQLQEDPLIAWDGTLNGIPWGTVNYHPDKCADQSRHMHVVWQRDTELRRARVDKPQWHHEPFWSDGPSDWFIQATYCAKNHEHPKWMQHRYIRHTSDSEIRFLAEGIECVADTPHSSYSSNHECIGHELDEAAAAFYRDLGDEKTRRARHDNCWKQLAVLPQLFIAV